jgi:hypothetical protein
VRYVLIPTKDTALGGVELPGCGANSLSDDQRDALARAFEHTVQTCELLVTYALGVAGRPSRQ